MGIILPLILIGGGLAAIFYFRPKTQNNITEIKYMQTKSIQDLKNMFSQMDESGVGNQYREFVELKGSIVSENLVQTPFSNKEVAYFESRVAQVVERKEEYTDSDGNRKIRTNRVENEISSDKSSQDISLKDGSSNDTVVLDINASGCNLDIPKTFDRFEPKNNVTNYSYFNSFSLNRYGADTLGFKMTEETIDANQRLYVIGEAYKSGNQIHIGKPQDSKKPFIVTTRTEEDIINSSTKKALYLLVGGIIAVLAGAVMMFSMLVK